MRETLLARKFSDAIGAPFAEAFRHQYVLSKRQLDLDEFTQLRLGAFHLYHSPDLPVTVMSAEDGTRLGYILGYAITREGILLRNEVRLGGVASGHAKLDVIDGRVSEFSGRFVVVLSTGPETQKQSRLYIDPIGALGAMYDAGSGIVASSLLLALNRDLDPHPVFEIPKSVTGMPEFAGLLPEPISQSGIHTTSFGQSFDCRVNQLLTNHALDLESFRQIRMPVAPPDPRLGEPETAAKIILSRLNRNLSAISKQKTGYLAISGGQDSRMVMAAAPRGFSARFPFYSYSDNWITGVDLHLAQALAQIGEERFIGQAKPDGTDGSYFPRAKRSHYFQKRCAISNGLKGTGDAWWRRGYFRKLEAGSFWLRGNALEVVTARLWTPTVDAPDRKAIRHALRRLGLVSKDRTAAEHMLQELAAWRETLPDHAQRVFHDFWYQELFLSHSQGGFLGYNDLIYFPPASDSAIFAAARAVDPSLRRTNVLYDAVIQQAGKPELAQIPLTRDITRRIKETGYSLESVLAEQM